MTEIPATDKERQTIDYYDKEAESWASAHKGNEDQSYWESEMKRFRELLPSGKVLEIGSGTGKDASALIALGYDYTGTDASEGLLKIARRRNPNANFKCVAVHNLEFGDTKFDGFWTAATLLHIPKERIDGALTSIKRVIKPRGVGFISMKSGIGEKTDTVTGRWFSYYSQDEFSGVLRKNNFQIVDKATRQGEKDLWLIFYVRSAS